MQVDIVFAVAVVVLFSSLTMCFLTIQIRNCLNTQSMTYRNRHEQLRSVNRKTDDTALLLPIRDVMR